MCFSPEASFAGGIIISAIGIVCLKKIHHPSQIVFASIPLFFGIQQIAEGCLWIALPNPNYFVLRQISTYVFLMMADVLWPVIIPIAVLFMEKDEKRKRALWVFLFLGIILSLYYSSCLLLFHVFPKIERYHIKYYTDFPKSLAMAAFILYLIVTIPPLFISSIKRMQLFGILMFLSCLITALFFTQYLTSVWCFFAALISGLIYWILRDSRRMAMIHKLKFPHLY